MFKQFFFLLEAMSEICPIRGPAPFVAPFRYPSHADLSFFLDRSLHIYTYVCMTVLSLVKMEDDRAPDLPSVAVKMVFGTTGVEEVEPKFLADFPRPSFKVAHSLVLKPVMSVKENMAVSKVCVVMPESKQAEVRPAETPAWSSRARIY